MGPDGSSFGRLGAKRCVISVNVPERHYVQLVVFQAMWSAVVVI